MDSKSKSEEIEANRLAYTRGLVAITRAVNAFAELTGIDLMDTVDTAGRHVGEAPYLKITAERLAEVTARITEDVDNISDVSADIGLIAGLMMADSSVVNLSAYRAGPVKP